MILLPVRDGYTVLAGVSWTNGKETITVKMAPASCNKNKSYKQRYKRTWKNYCPYCKKSGKLYAHGTKGRKKAPEGEITCKNCDTDFDGVSGKSKEGSCKYSLKEGSSSSDSNTTSEQKVLDKKKALGELKNEYKEKSKPKKDSKLTIPPLPLIREGSYIELCPPLRSTKTYFIIGTDESEDDVQLNISSSVPAPGSEYSEKYTTSISNVSSDIDKRIRLQGKKLKNVAAIYKWLKTGNGNFKYKYYKGHKVSSENENKFGKASAEWCWKNKRANCVDFAWIFYMMCRGAGIKVNVISGTATFPDRSNRHFWNKYKGKLYDCSSISARNYRNGKKVI